MDRLKTTAGHLCVIAISLSILIAANTGCGGKRDSSAAAGVSGGAGESGPAADDQEKGVSLADLTLEEPPAAELTDGPRDAYAAIAGVPPAGAAGGPGYSGYYKTNMAFDGNPRTWWAGERNKGTWDLYYGLPSAIALTQLTVNFYSSQYTPTNIKLYTSADGATWAVSGQISNPTSKPSFTLASVSAKYIRLEMTGNPPTGIPIIREIDWLPAAVKPGASAGPNYNDDWYFASNAFDGNPKTWWAGKANAGAWDIFYNFGTPRQVGLLTAAFYAINTRPATVSLYTSGDGITWTKTGDLSPEATSTIYVGAAVLYMKLSMTGNPPSTFPLLKDIYFDALPGAASPDSYSAFYSAGKAFDNKPASLWAGKKGAAEWNLYYTFPAPTAVTNVAIHYTDAAHTPAATDLYTSGDGITWTNTASFPAGTDPSAWAGVTVKYLRFKLAAATATASFFPTIKDIDVGGSTAAPSVQLKSPDGAVLPNINTGDDVYFGMTGLTAGAMYDINVTYPNGASYTLNLSANEAGVIPSSSVLTYDAGLPLDPADPGSGRLAGRMGGSMAGREALLLPGESIKVIVKKGGTTVTNFTVPYVTGGTKPLAYAANAGGYVRNSFVCSNNEDIYAAFRQFSAGEKVRAYIVADRIQWKIGDQLTDVSGGYETFTLPYNNNLYGPEYKIWTNSGGTCAPIGKYDLVIERGILDGFLDDGDIVDAHKTVGFMLQTAPSGVDIIDQIATDINFHYRNVFAPNETVYVYMNPKVRSRVLESFSVNGYVKKYVTHHKAVWNSGDSIIDQTAGIEGDQVQWGCYNESLVAVWPAPLTVGDYDIIIDGNKNGVYDPGVDFLDNIDENGQPNYGFRVQPVSPPCSAACVDDSTCQDTNPDTVNVCENPGKCAATCSSYRKSCDLTVDKVNYIPEQTMTITLTGRNESAADVKCGVEIALKRAKLTPVWNSFDDNIFITIPAGTEVVRTITKFIPSAWAGTDTRDGSDYAIYTVRDDKTRWDKGDNFNTHVRWECPITCLNATECDDHNAGNIDSCTNPATCSSTCTHSACAIACNSNAGCDDGNPLTIDACNLPGTCSAACANTACTPACSNDAQCGDGNPLTFDTCDLMNTCSASCAHTACAPACASNSQCNDNLTATIDVCNNANTCVAACQNCVPSCKVDSDCNDSNTSTYDVCANAGTCSASCSNCPNPACKVNTDCNDGNALTIDTCNNPGTCASSCSNTSCTPACASDAGCNDGREDTVDICYSPNTCNSQCYNSINHCSIDADCDDSSSATTDKCYIQDGSWSYCENFKPGASCISSNNTLKYGLSSSGRYVSFVEGEVTPPYSDYITLYDNVTKQTRRLVGLNDNSYLMGFNLSENYLTWVDATVWTDPIMHIFNINTNTDVIIPRPAGTNYIFGIDNYKNQVVFSAGVSGSKFDVYHYDGNTGLVENLTNTPTYYDNDYYPVIYKSTIVYYNGGQSALYSYDLNTKAYKNLTYAKAESIDFDGETIVWGDSRFNTNTTSYNDNIDIYMYKMSSGVTTRITTNLNQQSSPSIYGNRIMWLDLRNDPDGIYPHYYDIYMYDIATGVESRFTNNLSDTARSIPIIRGHAPKLIGNTVAFLNTDSTGSFNTSYVCKYVFP